MNTRLLFGLLWLTPTLCFGALSTDTSYFLNVEALTNVTARSAVRGLTGVFTNSITLNGDTRTAWPAGATAGTVINTGASTVGAVPRYTDTTGTNVAPSTTFNLGTSTNATLTGNLLANGATFTNGITSGASTFTGRVLGTGTTAASPAFASVGLIDSGLTFPGPAYPAMANNSTLVATFRDAHGITILNGLYLKFDPATSSGDFIFGRDGAANAGQFGLDAASPAAQNISGPDATGTDGNGGGVAYDGGNLTGTGRGGNIIIRTANTGGTSGTAAGTYSERFHAVPKWVTLTSATATTLFTVPIPATNYVGLTATVTVYATDGTDHQSKTSVITFDGIAKTTVVTSTISQVDNATAASAGTLTVTYSKDDGTANTGIIKLAADSSLTETVLRAKIVITAINANGTGVVTEQ